MQQEKCVAARVPVKADSDVWTKTIEHEGNTYTICAHPVSRHICCMKLDSSGKETYSPLPFEYRHEEKKNPVLYGERLKLFYLCDQGVKIENNDLRFHEKKEQQEKYNKVVFNTATDMAGKGEACEKHGRQYILPSSYSHGKRAYAQRYYDAMAVCLHVSWISLYKHVSEVEKSRPDLFITMTGTTITRELYRLRDGRTDNELVELANRIFALKLKE